MALKDWKLEKKNKDRIVWVHKKTMKHIILTRNFWNVSPLSWMVSTSIYASDDKYFRTKSAALRFASNYRRMH